MTQAVMGSGAARAPGHRVKIGRDGTNVGVPGELRPMTRTQICHQSLTSLNS